MIKLIVLFFLYYVPHPELGELIVNVLPHQRQVKQVKSCLLWSRYPGRKEKSMVYIRRTELTCK